MTVVGIGAGAPALAQSSGCMQSDPVAPDDPPQSCRSFHAYIHHLGLGNSQAVSRTHATSHGRFKETGYAMPVAS